MNSIQFSTGVRFAVQFLLLLSTWSGPIPIGHTHAFAAETLGPQRQLMQHVFYNHRRDLGQVSNGSWHVHWIVRGANYSGLNAEATVAQTMCSVSVAGGSEGSNFDNGPLAGDAEVVCTCGWEFAYACSPLLGNISVDAISSANWLVGHSSNRIILPNQPAVLRC